MTPARQRMRVLIAGGGVAGLEALLALRVLARDLVEVEVICPDDQFVFRPMLVADPFGAAEVLRLNLSEVIAGAGARLTRDAVASLNPAARIATTVAGEALAYDAIIVAVGAKPVDAVPGALTFRGSNESSRLGQMLQALGRRGAKRLAFVVPPGVSWSIAAYELALLTAAERDARRLKDVELTVVTHESTPLQALGPAASQLVASRLEEAGVSVQTERVAERVEGRELITTSGEPVAAMGFVALPRLEAVSISGLPQRAGGFVQTDSRMQVVGLDAVWAAGDITWFPVKQGGLAAQEADVAARSIAAAAGAHVPIEPFHPVLRAALVTGGAPEFLRADLARGGPSEATAGSALWWPPAKVAGRYLGPYLARLIGNEPGADELTDLPPPVDRNADAADHERAMSVVLAAADAAAAADDFEAALKWLALAEQLDFVLPGSYVARRYGWRLQLDPSLEADAAVARIDPTFASPEAAMRDLERRVGWMRELERDTGDEMRAHLSELDSDMNQVRALSERAGIFRRRD